MDAARTTPFPPHRSLGERLRGLFEAAWERARRRRRRALALAAAGALVVGAAVAALQPGRETPPQRVPPAPRPPVSLALSARVVGKHDALAVTITAGHATGVFGRALHSYSVAAAPVAPASGCVNNRDRVFPNATAGRRVSAELDPARGEGGPEGWCSGRFRGTVTYHEAFACRPGSVCHVPPGFHSVERIVTRFSFRVT